MAFVYMNVPPVFKTCMGEVDLDGNGRILKELCVTKFSQIRKLQNAR